MKEFFSISEVAQMFNLPVSTIRYYDKLGFFPQMRRKGQIRQFSQTEIEALRLIACLKHSGMSMEEIGEFMKWTTMGPSTYSQRKDMFEKQREKVLEEIRMMEQTLKVIDYKCWYYQQAMEQGNETALLKQSMEDLPKKHQEAWQIIHHHEPEQEDHDSRE